MATEAPERDQPNAGPKHDQGKAGDGAGAGGRRCGLRGVPQGEAQIAQAEAQLAQYDAQIRASGATASQVRASAPLGPGLSVKPKVQVR